MKSIKLLLVLVSLTLSGCLSETAKDSETKQKEKETTKLEAQKKYQEKIEHRKAYAKSLNSFIDKEKFSFSVNGEDHRILRLSGTTLRDSTWYAFFQKHQVLANAKSIGFYDIDDEEGRGIMFYPADAHIQFAVHIGVWRDVPDSVREYIRDKSYFMNYIDASNGDVLNKVYVGGLKCLSEAETLLRKVKTDGYTLAHLTAFNREQRITMEEASALSACQEE